MEKIITINNWWDGALSGLAYYNNMVCIYERIFDDTVDEWSNEYFLTPIDPEAEKRILDDWELWKNAVYNNTFDKYYSSNSYDVIDNELKKSDNYHIYRKKAKFHGKFEKGYIPVEYFVEWF